MQVLAGDALADQWTSQALPAAGVASKEGKEVGSQPQKGPKPGFSFIFLCVFGTWGPFQSLLQALASNFPSKMRDLDAYLPSYCTFCRF